MKFEIANGYCVKITENNRRTMIDFRFISRFGFYKKASGVWSLEMRGGVEKDSWFEFEQLEDVTKAFEICEEAKKNCTKT